MARRGIIPKTQSPGNSRLDNAAEVPGANGRGGETPAVPPAGGGEPTYDPAEFETGDGAAAPDEEDRYDAESLGLPQDYAAEADVAKQWSTIKVEKPPKSRVFRVHPTLQLKAMLLALKEDNEVYIVPKLMQTALKGEALCGKYVLLPCVTKAGTPFLWPIRMADKDGDWNVWHQSAWQIAEKARVSWCRMEADRNAGCYVAHYDQRPPERQQEPAWPNQDLNWWLRLAFRGLRINSLDHPVLKRLRLED
jgi:hypothetical protein